MPLAKGASRKTIAGNIAELHRGPQFRRTMAEHGKDVANKQAVAIALRAAGKAKPRKRTIAESGSGTPY